MFYHTNKGASHVKKNHYIKLFCHASAHRHGALPRNKCYFLLIHSHALRSVFICWTFQMSGRSAVVISWHSNRESKLPFVSLEDKSLNNWPECKCTVRPPFYWVSISRNLYFIYLFFIAQAYFPTPAFLFLCCAQIFMPFVSSQINLMASSPHFPSHSSLHRSPSQKIPEVDAVDLHPVLHYRAL